MRHLQRAFFARDAVLVAGELLGKVLRVGECAGRIVETEAYRPDDPASHSHRGETRRNQVMFGAPGHLYVYFTYGMHHCANVVTGPEGEGSAVLIRALEPLAGIDLMRERRRSPRRDVDLTNGPAKSCEALDIDLTLNGVDLITDVMAAILDDGTPPPRPPARSARIGISRGRELLWRFYVPESEFVSRSVPSVTGRTSAP